jgi:hypothetical protein
MNIDIDDYAYIGSTIGNAYFSGLAFDELWECVFMSETPEELDAAISATIRLKELSCNNEN